MITEKQEEITNTELKEYYELMIIKLSTKNTKKSVKLIEELQERLEEIKNIDKNQLKTCNNTTSKVTNE